MSTAIKAMLSAGELGSEYIEELLRTFEYQRDHGARDCCGDLAKALDDGDLELGAANVEDFLANTRLYMSAILQSRMWHGDGGRAATLFLHCVEQGHFPASETEIKRARSLLSPLDQPQPATVNPDELQVDIEELCKRLEAHRVKRRDLQTPEETRAWLKSLASVLEARKEMAAVCGDPAAPWFRKLAAIDRWLGALEAAGEWETVVAFCMKGRLDLLKAQAGRNAA